eukprot:Clim_evm2s108 gene=Clim_evmTU2s108
MYHTTRGPVTTQCILHPMATPTHHNTYHPKHIRCKDSTFKAVILLPRKCLRELHQLHKDIKVTSNMLLSTPKYRSQIILHRRRAKCAMGLRHPHRLGMLRDLQVHVLKWLLLTRPMVKNANKALTDPLKDKGRLRQGTSMLHRGHTTRVITVIVMDPIKVPNIRRHSSNPIPSNRSHILHRSCKGRKLITISSRSKLSIDRNMYSSTRRRNSSINSIILLISHTSSLDKVSHCPRAAHRVISHHLRGFEGLGRRRTWARIPMHCDTAKFMNYTTAVNCEVPRTALESPYFEEQTVGTLARELVQCHVLGGHLLKSVPGPTVRQAKGGAPSQSKPLP